MRPSFHSCREISRMRTSWLRCMWAGRHLAIDLPFGQRKTTDDRDLWWEEGWGGSDGQDKVRH